MQRHLSTYIGRGSLCGRILIGYAIYELLDSSISMIILCHYVTSRHMSNIRVCVSIFTMINKMMIDGKVISLEFIKLIYKQNLFADVLNHDIIRFPFRD